MRLQILKKDNNGGHSVNIPIAVLAIVVTIIIAAIPFVIAYGALNEKVDSIEKEIDDAGPRHTEIIDKMEERIIALEKIASGVDVSLRNIERDIVEIKGDVKDLRKEVLS